MSRRAPRPRGALNHALHRAYDALLPHRRRDPARLEESRPVDTDRLSGQPSSATSLQLSSGTSLPMSYEPTPMPAAPTAAAPPATLQAGTQSSALIPVASPAPADPSEELTVDSLRDLLAESADATVDSIRTALLSYLTLMARHQVQLSISPPLQGAVRTQRRLNDALGFDQVLASVQPLSNTLSDLPRAVGELTAQLKISREEAAAAKRLLVPVQLRVESLETLLNKSTAEVNGLQAVIKRLKSANVCIGSLLEKSKESMDVRPENLRLAMSYAEQKQDIIDALDKQIEKEREVFKTTVSANTENTRKLHNRLPKATQGTWVDADTAALIADLKDRNLHLLRTNRALRGFVSFAGMDPNTLTLAIQGLRAAKVDLSTLGLDQDTILALHRFQQEAGDQEDPFAHAEALAKTAQQVQSSTSKRSRHGSDDGNSEDSSEEKTPIPSGRGSRAGSAAAAGEESAAAASSPTSSRRGLHMPKAWKNKPKSKRQKTASPASARSRSSLTSRRSTSRPPARSPSAAHAKSLASHPRSRSHSVSSRPAKSKSPASPPSAPATPPKAEPSKDNQPAEVLNLTRDESDEDMEEEPTAVPTEPEDTDVTRPASPTRPATSQRSNVAPPSSRAPSPPVGASQQAPTSYDLEMQLLFGSDDDEEAPSGSKASREPAGLMSPYRSSSDEDTPSPPKRSDSTPISKQPSVPPSPSPDSSDSDEGGSSNGSHDGDGAGGNDSHDDEPSFDFPSGDSAGDEDIPPSTDVSRASAVVEGSVTGVQTLLPRELPEAPNHLLRSLIPHLVKPRLGRLKLRLHCQEFSRGQRLLVITLRLWVLH
ncbi:hypothetical protein F443_18841 [Phytophthora nicotianae P1569]|uniref:Uncharacterized protein n=1 Tax=Phytophthora nicotianae P1569 TaxID=1317065 RepID=V9E8X4_PHYNI|nr:hypothetical protein F443_18841 [Phytophthora nicotianae P1569]